MNENKSDYKNERSGEMVESGDGEAGGGAGDFMKMLSKNAAPRSVFANYMSLITCRGTLLVSAELDEWRHEAECFRNDMDFLLNCKHHEFWSYMVYQKAALAAVVSFLQNATPFYIDIGKQTTDRHIIELYEEILALVLRVLCRVLTQKESSEQIISREQLRELIYKNYLLSVPMLFDLLLAVGDVDTHNVSILHKIFDTLLQIEPNYLYDLKASLEYFKSAYRSIQTQAENEGFEGAGGGVPLDDDGETPYDDVALFALDCSYTLSVLLEVYPAVRVICNEIKLGPCIAHFYDTTIPFLYKNICLINESALSLFWLNQARLQLLRSFRSIAYAHIEDVLNKSNDESLNSAEQYIALLTESLSEQAFVMDYQREYPVEFEIDVLRQTCRDLDDFKVSFVLKGYQKEAESSQMSTIENVSLSLQRTQADKLTGSGQPKQKPSPSPAQQNNDDANTANAASKRDLDIEVSAVLDVLPNLGTGYVRRILSRYDTSEDAIAAILEENLPPDLADADQTEVYIPADPQDQFANDTGIKHFNVHDGDRYDVLTQEKPNCIIKRGKGFPGAKNAAQLLDDKSDMNAIRHRYQEYTLVTEDSDHDEYNDEYDDSYEALLESETRVAKSKELKAGLANIADVSDGDSSGDDPNEDNRDSNKQQQSNVTQRRNEMNFCENPEITRSRYEAKRQAKMGNRHNADFKSQDVIGQQKGQGQDNETLRNRQRKEVHKSSRANHNRKAGAAFKRSKGMMS